MQRWIRSSIIALTLLPLIGCGGMADQVTQGGSTDQIASAAATQAVTSAPTSSGESAAMDQSAAAQPIEDKVKADLASYLGTSVDQISTIEIAERTWPDRGLGCRIRSGVFEPQPIAGFLITLEHNGQAYPYHTDRASMFVRCLDPGKPLDPITR